MKYVYIIGGGTFSPVRNHCDIAVDVIGSSGVNVAMHAFGETALKMKSMFDEQIENTPELKDKVQARLVLTKMADPRNSSILTNQDVEALVDQWVADPQTKAIIFNVALADFSGTIENVPSGTHAERLSSKMKHTMVLTPQDKIIGKIRKERKDIFVVGFKTTCNESSNEQYKKALALLKQNSINLVLANDTGTRNNMIVAPEETRYHESQDRQAVLDRLVAMTLSRMQNTFTRSTVVEGETVSWQSSDVPENLRQVVNHCIEKGAYKPFLGKTAGHFAVKINEHEILTSIRKSNFNDLKTTGLVHVTSRGPNEVIARGHRPSVGGQSQRIIFSQHPELDCIVHFHCPIKPEKEMEISIRPQWPNECGSHECGQNTSNGLKKVDLGEGDSLHVVFLDDHGPNVVFNKSTPAQKVIHFIDQHFDLSQKTGGLVQ